MIGALTRNALAVIAALLLYPGPLSAQEPLPTLTGPGGGLPNRLSPQDIELANRRRDLEGVLSQLRELHARGQYEEMMRLIQDAERSYPNDFKLRNYGYLAQQGLEQSQRTSLEPVVAPDSPALRGMSDSVPTQQTSPVGSSDPAAAPLPGLPSLPSLNSPPSGVSEVPPNSDAVPPTVDSPAPVSQDIAPADAAPSAAESEGGWVAKLSGVSKRLTGPVPRLVLIGVAVLAALLGAFALLRRRKLSAEAEAAARRSARTPSTVGRTSSPPPIPASALSGGVTGSVSMRDALTEVEANEEEVARGIAESIGTRPAAAPATAMPAFESLFPTGNSDQPTGFHENMPTMVDTLVDDEPHSSFPFFQDEPSAPTGPIHPPSPRPAPVVTPTPESGGVSFDDLGIVLFEKPADAPAAETAPATSPLSLDKGSTEKGGEDPFAGFNFAGLSAPENKPEPLLAEPPKASAPAKPAKSFPGLPAGDEPIRLDDLNLRSPAEETVSAPYAGPAAEPPRAAHKADSVATVDLSEVLFGSFDEPTSGQSKNVATNVEDANVSPRDATVRASAGSRTASPFDETVATPVVQKSPSNSGDLPISLDSLSLSFDDADSNSSPDAATQAFTPSSADQDTVQISSLSLDGAGDYHPDDALSATISLDEATIGIETQNGSVTDSSSVGPATPSVSKPEDQSYYASAPRVDGSLDERSERMFHEQFERAEKAIGEANWKQAVHYLSIAAAIRPEDSSVIQKLKHAREQKRRQEAGV